MFFFAVRRYWRLSIGSSEITRSEFVSDENNRLWINDAQYFTGVDDEVCTYSVRSIQIVSQWLSDRQGRTLSTDEIDSFRGIIGAISRLCGLPSEIDVAVEDHGGWPLE